MQCSVPWGPTAPRPHARALCQLGTALPACALPPRGRAALAPCPYPPPRWQAQLPAAPQGAPGRVLLRGRPCVGNGVVPIPGGLGGLSVRGSLLPREHGGDAQRGRAPRGPCAPAALGPGHAAAGAGVSGLAWGRPPWGRGWGLPGSQRWGRARTSCPSAAEWEVRSVLSPSCQPRPEPRGGCACSQLRCWRILEPLGTSCRVLHGSNRACSSADKAGLAYAIAADHGCIWDMKFCPSGAWEPPTAARKVGVLTKGPPRPWGPPLVSPGAPKSVPSLRPCLPGWGTATLGLSQAHVLLRSTRR